MMTRTRNRYPVIMLLLLVTAFASGCHFRVGYAGTERAGAMTAHYFYCSESKTRTIRLEEGDQLSFSCAIEVKSGTVALLILDPAGEALWQAELTEDAEEEFVITADQSGDYSVRLELKGTRGAYAISWSEL